MKRWTFFRLIILSLFLGACSRNPLGEDLKQPILNLAFSLSQACNNSFNQDATYSCTLTTSEVVPGISFTLDTLLTTCAWASIDSTTGEITGTPNDDQVGICQVVVSAQNTQKHSLPFGYSIQVNNLPATFTIANAAPILEDSPVSVIRDDAAVQASEEGFGTYSFDHTNTTGTRCFDHAATLTINATSGAISYAPAADYFGTCNIRVAFNDGNAAANSIVTAQFSITVINVNDPPTVASIATQTTNVSTPITVNLNVNDIDSTLSCATSLSATSSNLSVVAAGSFVFAGTIPNCTVTITPQTGAVGNSNITITATDGALTASQTFQLNVVATPQPPVLAPIASPQTGNEDTPLSFTINITDPDTVLACNSTYLSATSSNATLLPAANITFSGSPPNCTVTMTPTLNNFGSSNVTINLTDGGFTVSRNFVATFNPVNDDPTISAIGVQSTLEDTPFTVNFTINDVDNTLNCVTSMSASTSNAAIIATSGIVFSGTAPNCTATITPVANANGVLNLTFTVSDGSLTASQVFTTTVIAVNDPPVLSAIGPQTGIEDTVKTINFTITDVDNTLNCATSMSAATSNPAIVALSGIVFSGTAPNCTATITPVANANGTLNLTFTVSDGALTDFETFSINFAAVNDAPVLSSIGPQTATEDVVKTINFTITDVDSTLNCVTSMTAATSNAAIVPVGNIVFSGTAPNCTATITPVANANGTLNLTFTVSDGALSSFETFAINFAPVNDAPVMSTITAQTTPEDTPLAVNFTITDIDSVLSCSALNLTATSSNTALIPVANIVFSGTVPNCTATLTPATDANGSSNITFIVNDNGTPNLQDTKSFTFTVTPVNDAPVLSPIVAQTGTEDTVKTINFTITDVDSTLNCVTSMAAGTSNAAIVPVGNIVFSGTAPNCTATITPVADANGPVSLTFTVSDGVLSNFETFTLTFAPVNDAPVISAIPAQFTTENTPLTVNFTISDIDSTLSCTTSMTATSSNTALLPTANIVFSGTAPNCTATLTPSASANGTSNVSFIVSDGSLSANSNFSFTVTAFNDPPVLSSIGPQTGTEDTVKIINFTITDIDNTLDCVTSMSAATSNSSIVALSGIVFSGTAPNCTATITPVADANGTLNLTFTVTDTGTPVKNDFETFSINFVAVNDAPVLSNIPAQTVSEDNSRAVNFTITDVDNTLSCTTSVSATSSNTALLPLGNIVFSGTAPNCTATLTPVADASGVSNISFTVTDGSLTDVKNFTFTVNAVNDAPILSTIGAQTGTEDTVKTINFTITDVDNTLDCVTSMSAATSNAAIVPVGNIVFSGTAPNCTATITPVADANGSVNLTFTVTDGTLTDFETFAINFAAVNDPPLLSNIPAQTVSEDNSRAVNFTITDVDSTLNCTTSMSATSSNTALIPVANIVFSGTAPNCTATLTPLPDANGVSNISFTVTDGSLTDVKNFTFTVNAVNDAPVLSPIGAQTGIEDTVKTINFTITDVDNTLNCTTSMSAATSNAAIVPVGNIVFSGAAPNCTATITPVADANGPVNLTFTVTDGTLTAAETFTLTIAPVNDAPVLSPIGAQTGTEDTVKTINFTITDVDNTLNCATSMSAATSNSAIVALSGIVFSGTAPNCTATITPVADANGPVNLTFTVSDGSLTAFETFAINFTPVNDAPILSTIGNQTTLESTPITVNFTASDVDNILACSSANLSATSSNTTLMPVSNIVFSGTVPNCSVTFTPVTGLFGTSNISITLNDNGTPNLQAVQNFVLTVTEFNDPPVLSSIGAQTGTEDTVKTINFTITDPDNTLDCVTSMSAATSNSSIVALSGIVFSGTAPNCTATITPVADANGTLNLTFTVTDTGTPVKNDFETFSINFSAVNDAPVMSNIPAQTTSEDNSRAVNFTITDVDNTLSCTTSVSATSSNTALLPVGNIVFSGTAPNCTATLTPVADASGISNISFTVTDGSLTDVKNFTFTVNAVNDAPILSTIGAQTGTEDTVKTINFTITDVDSTLNCVTSMSAATSNAAIVPVGNIVFSGTAPNCTATITPVLDANGSVNLTFTVSDGSLTDFETFAINFAAVNDAPIMSVIGNQNTNEDTALDVSFTITDVDNTLTCSGSVTASTSTPSLVDVSDIVFSGTAPNCNAHITPKLNQNGAVNLTFRVSDLEPLHDDKTFTLTVNAVNDAPTISNIADLSTNEDTATSAIAFTIGDVDNVLLCNSTNVSATSSNTALVPNANLVIGGTYPNCTITATPTTNANGTTTITVTVNDNGTPNLQASDSFVLTVIAINDPPTISSIANQTINEDTSTGALAFTIGDIETGPSLTCSGSVTATSSNTTVVPTANIVITGTAPNCFVNITPAPDQFGGPIAITLRVTDTGLPLPAEHTDMSFNLTVNNVNDAPILSAISDRTVNENAVTTINFTITDIDSVLSCTSSMSATSSNTALVPVANIVFSGTAPNCTATITSLNQQNGVTNISFTVSDGSLTDTKSFVYTVLAVDDPPAIDPISDITKNEDNSATATLVATPFTVNFTVNDPDTTIACNATYLSGSSNNQAIVKNNNITFSGTIPNCVATILMENNSNTTANGPLAITITATDGNSSASRTFNVTVNPINDPPVISSVSNQTTNKNVPITVFFTITDVDNVLSCDLAPTGSMTRSSSNTTRLPTANIVFGGTAPNCSATLTPGTNQIGNVGVVTFRVTDGITPAQISFALNINDPPTISAISNTSFPAGVPTPINFTINDTETALDCVANMSATSSNSSVVSTSNIVFSGSAPNCTATVTASTTGSSNLTFTVNDGTGGTASSSNTVTGLAAGTVVVSQAFSTLTATANSSLNTSKAFVIANEALTLTVTVRDSYNSVAGAGHWVVIQKASGGTSDGTLSAVTDNGDGTYTATFTASTIGTARSFNAYIDGYPITSVMPQVTVSSRAPNCLSYKNVGYNTDGIYPLDIDGDAGEAASFNAYCDMTTHGGGWTLVAVPRKGIAPFTETAGLLSPVTTSNARNSSIWFAQSNFQFTKLRVTDDASAAHYSAVNFAASETIADLLATYPSYSQNNLVKGATSTNSVVASSIGSTCFIIRGQSAQASNWDDSADYIFMGFHGGSACSTPFDTGNNWDRANTSQQWLISGADSSSPETVNNTVGQNTTSTDWINQDSATLIWLK